MDKFKNMENMAKPGQTLPRTGGRGLDKPVLWTRDFLNFLNVGFQKLAKMKRRFLSQREGIFVTCNYIKGCLRGK